jgi:hypothetical protein
MSYDPKAGLPPMGHMEQKPSGRKWWLLGGCGCVVLLLICGGGGVGLFFWLGKPTMDFMNQNLALARSSDAIKEALGEPIELDEAPDVSNETVGGKAVLECRYRIKGSKAAGKLVIRAIMNKVPEWDRESMKLILDDGTEIDVNPDAEFKLDINLGEDNPGAGAPGEEQ